MMDFRMRPEENENQYLWRIYDAVKSGETTWNEVTPTINAELFGDDIEKYRDESAYRKKVKAADDFVQSGVFNFTEDEYLNQLAEQRRKLQKERVKFQTEKLEYNRWLRSDARDELIVEKIQNALQELPKLPLPKVIPEQPTANDKEYLLLFGDEHYGVEFRVEGLLGEVINEYSPEIFERRMSLLLGEVIALVKREKIRRLYIISLGDQADGLLRVKQLLHLRYGVIDSTIKYAEYLSNWLNELSKYVRIVYSAVEDGNHTQLRMLGQPKGTFENENTAKFVEAYIKARMMNNPNFKYAENRGGYVVQTVCGANVVAFHGECKDVEAAAKELSLLYDFKIDCLITGHKHHSRAEEILDGCEVVQVPSIVGTDPYSASLYKSSAPAAKLMVFEDQLGKVCEYTIKLGRA